jgi:hypothetical protein
MALQADLPMSDTPVRAGRYGLYDARHDVLIRYNGRDRESGELAVEIYFDPAIEFSDRSDDNVGVPRLSDQSVRLFSFLFGEQKCGADFVAFHLRDQSPLLCARTLTMRLGLPSTEAYQYLKSLLLWQFGMNNWDQEFEEGGVLRHLLPVAEIGLLVDRRWTALLPVTFPVESRSAGDRIAIATRRVSL